MPWYINNLSLFWYLLLHIGFPHITRDLGFMHAIILMHKLELCAVEVLQKKDNVSIYMQYFHIKRAFFFHILSNWINVSDAKSSWQTYFFPPSQMGLVIIFHNYRHADKPCHCPPAPAAGKVVLQIIMAALCCCFYSYWAASHRTCDSCISIGHVISLKAFMVLGLYYWNVT